MLANILKTFSLTILLLIVTSIGTIAKPITSDKSFLKYCLQAVSKLVYRPKLSLADQAKIKLDLTPELNHVYNDISLIDTNIANWIILNYQEALSIDISLLKSLALTLKSIGFAKYQNKVKVNMSNYTQDYWQKIYKKKDIGAEKYSYLFSFIHELGSTHYQMAFGYYDKIPLLLENYHGQLYKIVFDETYYYVGRKNAPYLKNSYIDRALNKSEAKEYANAWAGIQLDHLYGHILFRKITTSNDEYFLQKSHFDNYYLEQIVPELFSLIFQNK